MIITRTPFRISFFGGGTDYPTWAEKQGGCVVATTINKYCYITCRHLPPFFEHKHRIVYSKIENVVDPEEIQHPAVRAVLMNTDCSRGFEIHHDGDLPARSGLGSSSSFTVGLLNALKALQGRHISHEELAKLAIHIEQDVIRENVGSQDQISAAYGGFNRIEFPVGGGFRVDPVVLPRTRLEAFQDRLMLFFTGLSRFASEIAKSKIDNLEQRHAELVRMREMTDEGIAMLQGDGPLDAFGELLDQGWQYKRRLSDKVSTAEVDRIYDEARSAGAIGGKLLGAGGGGFMLFFVRPEDQARVRERLQRLVHVPFRFEQSGSRVVLYQPNGLS
jgi:D-glycero-alpha-D-manno-heptose-7-phosphate kinase